MKLKKIVVILAMFILIFSTNCFATIDTDKFKPGGLQNYEEPFDMAGTIVGVLQVVGTVVAVLGIVIIGIKFMMGSVEQKAEYKKTLIPYLVGCIFIFAIPTIVSIIYGLATQIN